MNLPYERYSKVVIKVLLIAAIFFSIYFIFSYMIPYFAPFWVAILIAIINEPVVDFLEKKTKLRRSIASIISLVLTMSVLGFLIMLGMIKIYHELIILQDNVSSYITSISDQLTDYFNRATIYYQNLPEDVTVTIKENLQSLAPKLEYLVTSLVGYLIGAVSSIPKIVVFIIVTLLSAYFISSDRREIRQFLYRQLPSSWSQNFSGIKSDTFKALLGFFRAILILMSITFVEVSVGLFIMRADYALLMGLIVAIAEVIPVLGTGIVMVPWIAFQLIVGDIQMAIGLSIIYVLGVIIRQVMEPKIVGDQIGLHPLVTLIAMYLGLEFMGIIGMVLGPVSIIILKSLQHSRVIKLWND